MLKTRVKDLSVGQSFCFETCCMWYVVISVSKFSIIVHKYAGFEFMGTGFVPLADQRFVTVLEKGGSHA
ncbi:hypothetical protein D3C87_1857960 [compost metagenome]